MQSQPNAADNLSEDDEQRPTLVRELLCAAIHSRAAYGYAMAAGHMSNLLNFALMHTVHQIRYCIRLVTRTPVTPEEVVPMNPFPQTCPPSSSHALAAGYKLFLSACQGLRHKVKATDDQPVTSVATVSCICLQQLGVVQL